MVQDGISVEEVQYGDGIAEAIGLANRTSEMERKRIILMYVPLKTNTWKLEEHNEMEKEVK